MTCQNAGMVGEEQSDNARMTRLKRALERELQPDESVQWHGWQLGRIEPQLFMIYIFAVPWTAFAVMWTVLATGAVGVSGFGLLGIAFPLFGLPFIAIGVWMLSRPFVPLWERGRVLYVVTNRRAIRLSLGRELAVTSVPAERIGLVERRERDDGSGTLNQAVKVGRDSDGDRQVEYFAISLVPEAIGAQAALDRIAGGPKAIGPANSPGGALSS